MGIERFEGPVMPFHRVRIRAALFLAAASLGFASAAQVRAQFAF
jgi:hypothetical protein